MKNIIKFLYKRYPLVFYAILSEDFLGQIPKETNDAAIAVLDERQVRLQKWLLWQSHVIQRKAMSNLRMADFYLGMLTQVKLMFTIVTNGGSGELADKGTEKKVIDILYGDGTRYSIDMDKARAGIENFKQKKVPAKT